MGTRDAYVATLKSAFVSLGTKGLVGLINGAAPWTMNPLVDFILQHILDKILSEIADLAEIQAFFIYVDFRVGKQGTDFFAAAKNYQKAKLGTPKEKADAQKILIDRARELIDLLN